VALPRREGSGSLCPWNLKALRYLSIGEAKHGHCAREAALAVSIFLSLSLFAHLSTMPIPSLVDEHRLPHTAAACVIHACSMPGSALALSSLPPLVAPQLLHLHCTVHFRDLLGLVQSSPCLLELRDSGQVNRCPQSL